VFGTIQSIAGSTLTVAGANGKTTRATTSDTTVVTMSAPAQLGDVAVGDRVVATGTPDGTAYITATRIVDSGMSNANSSQNGDNRPSSGRGFSGGTVTKIDGTALTLQDREGATITVTTSAAAQFTRNAQAPSRH